LSRVYFAKSGRSSTAEDALRITHDMITAIYAVAVVTVINLKFADRSHTINNIIEYADALIFKLSCVWIQLAHELYLAVEHGPQVLNDKLDKAGFSSLHATTIGYIRKESWKSSTFTDSQSLQAYNDTITMIGDDDEVFIDHSGIRIFIEATAESQSRHVPIRWTSNVTTKLISCGINSKHRLKQVIEDDTINTIIVNEGKPKFNKITISGMKLSLKLDFFQGRS
jgi:energy-converting hydrogenase A subunit M